MFNSFRVLFLSHSQCVRLIVQREVQEKELSLIRDFESNILSLQDEDSTKRLIASTSQTESLARLSRTFRQFMRSVAGEDVDKISSNATDQTEVFEPWSASSGTDWALERECELSRLERENEELRRMLGASPRVESNIAREITRPLTTAPGHDNRILAAAASDRSVWPYPPSSDVHATG